MDAATIPMQALVRARDLGFSDAVSLSRAVHGFAETAWQEHRSAAAVADRMATWGFEVTRAAHGLDTAVGATFGTGDLVVTLCAEYDALPEIGHACGHNLIAATSCLAAAVLAAVSDELGVTVRLLGTPAEEVDGGKLALLRAGAFDDTHLSVMAHPATADEVAPAFLAAQGLRVSYSGQESHASLAPELGRNAGDAMTLAQVALGLLRQHLPPGDQLHGIVVLGGQAPNVVPSLTCGEWIIRSATAAGLETLRDRVADCFRAGALATGCDVQLDVDPAYLDVMTDPDLSRFYADAIHAAGRTPTHRRPGGASDMGNVSHVVPALHAMFAIDAGGAVNHQHRGA